MENRTTILDGEDTAPKGDTGDGDTGVPPSEQGISNRPGDRGTDDLMQDEDDTDGSV